MKPEKDAKCCYICQRKNKVIGLFVGLLLSTNMNLHLQIVKNSCDLKEKENWCPKETFDLLDNSGVHSSKIASMLMNQFEGVDWLNLTSQDIQNYLQTRRQKDLEKGDAQLMLYYFQRCQYENPGFVYAIQMYVDGHLANCFWVDA